MFQYGMASTAGRVTKANPYKYIGANRLQEAYSVNNARSIENLTATKQFTVAPTNPGMRMQGENAVVIDEGQDQAEGYAHITGQADAQTHNFICVGIATKGSEEQRYAYRVHAYCRVQAADNDTGPNNIIPVIGYREEDLDNLDTNRRVAKYGIGAMIGEGVGAGGLQGNTWRAHAMNYTVIDKIGGRPAVGTKTISTNPQTTLYATHLLFGWLVRYEAAIGTVTTGWIGDFWISVDRIEAPDQEVIILAV